MRACVRVDRCLAKLGGTIELQGQAEVPLWLPGEGVRYLAGAGNLISRENKSNHTLPRRRGRGARPPPPLAFVLLVLCHLVSFILMLFLVVLFLRLPLTVSYFLL